MPPMMYAMRAYVDKKITDEGGGDHSRLVDFLVEDPELFQAAVRRVLKDDEEIGHVQNIEAYEGIEEA